ncbi:hypothetical protein N7461_004529, partial [Penicillium sp. DV-2018c]
MNYLVLLMPFLVLIAVQAAPTGTCIHNTNTNTHIANITHHQATQLPYGAVLTHCTIPGTIALTFDDGPYIYTARILDTLAQHGARATFFLNGRNKGSIETFSELVQRASNEGHQLGSHTYNHASLDTLSYEEILHEMTALEEAFTNILGCFPTYMRLPFLRHSPVVLAAMADLRYHVIGASVDTKDYEHDDPVSNWISFEKFKAEVEAGGSIVLAHDAHRYTVELLVGNMLEEVKRRGLIPVTVGECLGDSVENWYRMEREV